MARQSRWLAVGYFWWFSVINLFLISIFWTLIADIFSDRQATRLFAFIAAGGSAGAIAGPVITTLGVNAIGIGGLMLVAAVGLLLVIFLVHLLMREREKLRTLAADTQQTTLNHTLPGNPFQGFQLLLKSPYLLGQAGFMLMMTWVATIVYFLQAELISKTYSGLEGRTVAFADLDLFVNAASALILIFGLGRATKRFGVTLSLVLTSLTMVIVCLGVVISPTLFMVQTARGLQRIRNTPSRAPAAKYCLRSSIKKAVTKRRTSSTRSFIGLAI